MRALLLPEGTEEPPDELLEAVGRQTRAPDEVFAIRHVAGFQDAIYNGLDAGTEWFWLVDRSLAPEPPALENLLGALKRVELLPAPLLLASKIVTSEGSLDPFSLPVPQVFDPDVVVAVFHERLLPVRVARRGSLLVNRRGLEKLGLPRLGSIFFGEDLVWSARLLKEKPGLFVPASVAVRQPMSDRAAEKRRRASVAEGVRLLLSDGLRPGEKTWFGGRLGEELLALMRGAGYPAGGEVKPSRRPRRIAAALAAFRCLTR